MKPVFKYKQKTYYRLNTIIEYLYSIAALKSPFKFYCEPTMEKEILELLHKGSITLNKIGMGEINRRLIEAKESEDEAEAHMDSESIKQK
jgi:hypothetical protein